MEYTKKTRIYRMVDKDSAKDIMSLFYIVKRQRDKYTIKDLILLKSFIYAMIQRQHEFDEHNSPIWATPHGFLTCILQGVQKIGSSFNYQYFIDSYLNYNNRKTLDSVFNFDIKNDYGKLL